MSYESVDAIKRMKTATGMSVNDIAGALIERALAEGWTVRPPDQRPATIQEAGQPHTPPGL